MKKKILIISAEVWRPESDGGNVLTNLFSNLKDEFEFAPEPDIEIIKMSVL